MEKANYPSLVRGAVQLLLSRSTSVPERTPMFLTLSVRFAFL